MKPWLFVGAKVVTIDHGMAIDDFAKTMPALSRKEIFTVRDVVDYGHRGIGIRLVGVVGATHWLFGADCPYDANCFRPVSTIDASKQVETLKKIARDAFWSGRVDA